MFHKEGQKIILIAFFGCAAAVLLAQYYLSPDWL
jgi:phosphatidylserine decarboxylase